MKAYIIAAFMALPLTALKAETVEIGSAEFNDAVRAYLLENPEVIFEAVDIYNQRQEELAAGAAREALSNNHDALYDESLAVIAGNKDASKAIVEFIDYNCGYCRKAHAEVVTLLEKDSDLKVIMRHFPILSQGSLEASQIVIATKALHGDEAALELHNALYAHQGQVDKATALQLAAGLGYEAKALEEKLADPIVNAEIAKINELAGKLKIEGTPGFIIGDEVLRGYAPAQAMQAFIDNIKS